MNQKSRVKFTELYNKISKDSYNSYYKLNKSRNAPVQNKSKKSADKFINRLQLTSKRMSAHPTKQNQKRPKSAISNFKSTQSAMIKEDQWVNFIDLVQTHLSSYLKQIADEERINVIHQIRIILNLISSSDDYRQLGQNIIKFENQLSKNLRNRLSHLIFYIFLWKYNQHNSNCSIEKKINKLIICQYYSRKLNFKSLTILICLSIYEINILDRNYDESRKYAKKALRIAVVIKDQYLEYKAIENISKINFYQGKLNNRPYDLLTEKQRNLILKNYTEQLQMPLIFMPNQKKQQKTTGQMRYDFQQYGNFIQKNVPEENSRQFSRNFNAIGRKRSINKLNLLKVMKKVAEVGTVRKYIQFGNFITLKPYSSNIAPIHQEQVLITHTKMPVNHSPNKFMTSFVKIFKKILQETMQNTEKTTKKFKDKILSNIRYTIQ